MLAAPLHTYRLVTSSLGIRVPALYALKRLAHVDHFFHLTAPLARLRFPRLRTDIRFAQATEDDFREIERGIPALDAESRREVVTRVLFFQRGFSGCYLGRTERGDLVALQWLVRPQENALLQAHFPRLFYPLGEREVMTENVFIYPRFRGLGTFPTLKHHVLSMARDEGFRTCHSYVRKDNLVSLNGLLSLGFQVQRLLTAYSLLGRSWRNL
jgi:GNAT superfamily N-acetyltransferase